MERLDVFALSIGDGLTSGERDNGSNRDASDASLATVEPPPPYDT